MGMMGGALAQHLKDIHSRLYCCKVIWRAWKAGTEWRGGLQALTAELQRLEVDSREWKGLRRPAAVFADRCQGGVYPILTSEMIQSDFANTSS